MICRYFWTLAFVAGVSFTSAAPAAILVNETFEHSDGNLVGQTPTPGPGGTWANHSGTGTFIQVSDGEALIAQGSGSREDANTSFSPIGAGDVLYAGFDLVVTGGTTNVNFAHFMTSNTSTFNGRLWVTAPTTSGYRLAVSGDNSITDADGEAKWPSDLSLGESYRVVLSYDYDSQETTLWVDPVSAASSSITTTDGSFSDAIQAFALRQAGGDSVQSFDNLIIATTFDEALGAAPIPEPSTVLMTLMAVSAVGAVAMRRRLG